MRMLTAAFLGSVAIVANSAIAKDVSHIGSVEVTRGAEPGDATHGKVFLGAARSGEQGRIGIQTDLQNLVISTIIEI